MDFEGLNSILVMRRDEDNSGQNAHVQRPDHVEAIHARHLDIEKQQIRPGLLYAGHSIWPIARFTHDADIRLLGKKAKHLPARGCLVVGDKYSQRRWRTHGAIASAFKGTRIVTVSPPAF